jgi:hypothetical protein
MKHKIIILIALLLLLTISAIMIFDFYYKSQPVGNPWEYRLSDLRTVDKKEIGYKKINEIAPERTGIRGIAIDSYDNLLVTAENAILRYDENGRLYKQIEISGIPTCIAVDPNEKIFAGMKDRIILIQHNRIISEIKDIFDEKTIITGVAADENSLFVADAGNKIVYHLDHNGTLLNLIGERNRNNGFLGFIVPSGCFDIMLGREGLLWVVNPGKHQLLAFNRKGEIITSWSRTSMQLDGFSGCCNPVNIAMLGDGSFVTAEKGIERVKVHNPLGDYQCVIASPEYFNEGTLGIDVAVNSSGNVFVLDPRKNLIHVFQKTMP